MTQAVHQMMGQNRKTNGQCYDTWLFPTNHPIAMILMEAHLDFLNQVGDKRAERDQARKKEDALPPPLNNPASDMMVRLIVALMNRDLGPRVKKSSPQSGHRSHNRIQSSYSGTSRRSSSAR